MMVLLLFLLSMRSVLAGVQVYPEPPGLNVRDAAQPSTAYRVRVSQDGREQESFVYQIEATRLLDSRHNICSFSTFSFDGEVMVEVTRLGGAAIESCSVHPLSYGVQPEIVSTHTVRFRLAAPNRKMAVILNDDWDSHPLLLFGDELERDIPAAGPTNVVLFGPGVHHAGKIAVTHGQTVYLAGGAYVKGWIEENDLHNVTVRGRGILSAEDRPAERRGGLNKQTIYFDGEGSGLCVEGITFIQSKGFACTLRGSGNVMRNCKIVGNWVPTTDGFVMDDHGLVEDCFIKANDDAIKLYGSYAVARRCVIWQMENGGVFQLGWSSQNAVGCRVEGMDIIRTEWTTTDRDARGIIASVGLGGDGGGHVFENIRVERGGGRLLSLNLKPGSSATCSNIVIRNFLVDNWSPVEGQVNGAGFLNITLENFRLNGEWVTDAEQVGIKVLNGASGFSIRRRL